MGFAPINPKHFVPLGPVKFVERSERGLLLAVGEEKVRIEVIRADLVRIKLSRGKKFDETPTFAACFAMPAAPRFEVAESESTLELVTTALRVVISKRPFALDAYRTDGSVIFEDVRDEGGVPIGYRQLNDSFMVTRRLALHDNIYGLGQKTGSFDRRGKNYVLWNSDVMAPEVQRLNRVLEEGVETDGASTAFDPYYSSIPFFYVCRADSRSAKMAGFFIDNGYKAHFEFSHRDHYRYVFQGGQYTEYVFAGPSMPSILEGYTFVTGRMAAPPLWALGNHQCRFHEYDSKSFSAVGREYRERNIPCDVLWLDIGHMNDYRVFTWHPRRFPDVPGLLGKLRDQKFRVVTIVDPGVKVDPGYPVYDEGLSQNLFCKTDSGAHYNGQVWPGLTVFPEFVKAETRKWWGALNARHVESGLSGIWNDMNEPATGEIEPFGMRFDRDGENHPHERYHNQYALLMAMGTHEGLTQARPNERPFILTRAGFAGIQRYAAQWLGDNHSRWDHLRMSISMTLGLGVSGQPFIGADIPGFFARPTPELAMRWTQYGALTPFCRFHANAGEQDQYPWSFGAGVEKRCKEALELRYRLLPYFYTTFIKSSETGDPVLRPFVYDFQDDRQARETEDAFLLGEALLVAPVVQEGQSARHLYLPHGTWVDWHTGERHAGGQYITTSAPLDKVPLFARGGRVIPAHDVAPMSTMDHAPNLLVLHVAIPGEDGEFVSELHEDDGLTRAFERGAYLRTTFRVKRSGRALRISASVSGNGFPEFARKTLRIVFHGGTPEKLLLDRRPQFMDGQSFDFGNAGQGFELEGELQPESTEPRSVPLLRKVAN